MRSGPDVVILSEEHVVTVLYTAETTNTHTQITKKDTKIHFKSHVISQLKIVHKMH